MRILFFVPEDWYFISHRLPLASFLKKEGHDVCVMLHTNGFEETIEEQGLRLYPIPLKRNGYNPYDELKVIFRIVRTYKQIRPDIVHHVTLKPVLYGTIAARIVRVPLIVNAMAGLGFLYSEEDSRFGFLRKILHHVLKKLLNVDNARLIVQNAVDEEHFKRIGVNPGIIHLIRGAGVDLDKFSPTPPPRASPVVLLASRMLWQKGVGDFVRAAEILHQRGADAQFVLAGSTDPANPGSISEAQLQEWNSHENIRWVGLCEDMPALMSQCAIFCLPTYYREGVPKVLLEAAASGRPIVTTDTPGCRDVVLHRHNGLHVPPKDPEALADALEQLIRNASLRESMGRKSRKIAEETFSLDHVIRKHLEIYRELSSMGNGA